MVNVIQFPTDETVSDEEFQPRDRYGILVIGKNFYTGFVNIPDCPRWDPMVSGNLQIYDWELLMTGTVDFGERSPLNAIDTVASSSNGEDSVARINRVDPEKMVRLTLADLLRLYEGGKRRNGGYREVAKIWPGTDEVLPEFEAAVERISGLSDDSTLTTVVVFSHGYNGSIDIGESKLTYRRFLADLDRIHGKKAVFMYACRSGSFLKTLRLHEQRRDYAVISSCEADKLSTNWDDRALDDYLFRHFSKGRRYSDLELEKVELIALNQHPQMLRYFDVQLV